MFEMPEVKVGVLVVPNLIVHEIHIRKRPIVEKTIVVANLRE
jgi:hypothetical protein